jgi:hypothetical protein
LIVDKSFKKIEAFKKKDSTIALKKEGSRIPDMFKPQPKARRNEQHVDIISRKKSRLSRKLSYGSQLR